jgi:pimeloyl-ACP methyl ester carboxylesterase
MRIRGRRRRILLLAAILSYALVMTFGGCAETFLLHPSTQPLMSGAAQQLFVERDGRKIEVYTARSKGALHLGEPRAFLLEFTGNATRAEQVAEYIAQRWGNRPVEVWVMNYPGFGQSTGPAKLSAIPPAALATYDELSKRANGRPIFVAGNSLGTTSAIYVASQRPVSGAIIQGPVPLQRMILQRHGWWNGWLLAGPVAMQVPGELNCLNNAPQTTAPAVFILAGQDATVPVQYQRLILDAYAGPKRVLMRDHAGHNDGIEGADEARLQEAIDWLWEGQRMTIFSGSKSTE